MTDAQLNEHMGLKGRLSLDHRGRQIPMELLSYRDKSDISELTLCALSGHRDEKTLSLLHLFTFIPLLTFLLHLACSLPHSYLLNAKHSCHTNSPRKTLLFHGAR